jgi:eukaryotic-like serine/threonine-protein kinase
MTQKSQSECSPSALHRIRIGQAVSHYVLLEKLGTGGIGIVYKVRDTQLDRVIALKVLRSERIVGAPRDRFLREAKLASKLNHPNVITIYEVGEAEGIQFIAMELVKGKTLADLIANEELSLQQVLAFAVQIADGLAAAHAAGITHCDLKPANVMVTEDSLIKILDFGLAKLLTPPTQLDQNADTLEMQPANPPSADGGLQGTPAYMSPEQSEGRKLDTRTDVFSFGALLYEMVTGEAAFQADTLASTLSRIRHGEPEAVNSIAPLVPREIVWIIARCMRKDARRRFQHMEEIYAALVDVKEEYDSGRMGPGLAKTSSAAAAKPWPRWSLSRRKTYLAAGAVVAVALATSLWLIRAKATATRDVLSRLTWDLGVSTDPTLSSDGRLLAYASDVSGEGNLDIWVRHATGGQAIRLTHHPMDNREPAFNPDGSKIAFRAERDNGGIYVVPAFGGTETLIAKLGRRPRFSPDADWITYWVRDPQTNWGKIFIVPSLGGPARPIAQHFPDAHSPIWSPDGKLLLFCGTSEIKRPSEDVHDWWVVNVELGTVKRTGAFAAFRRAGLPPTHAPGSWLGRRIIFATPYGDSRNLWQIRISPGTLRAGGAPERLTFGTGVESRPFVTGEGQLVFASGSSTTAIWSLPMDSGAGSVSGKAHPLAHLGGTFNNRPSLSLSGNRCVFVSDREGHDEIWLHEFDSGSETVLTASSPEERAARKDVTKYALQPSWPIMSQDGSQVAYRVLRPSGGPAKQSIYTVAAGGGEPEQVCDDCGMPTGWAADGRHILFEPGLRRTPISLLRLPAGDQTVILAHPIYSLHQASFSPDDRWIAFHADLGQGRMRVYIAPNRDRQPIASSEWISVSDENAADSMPRWSPNGDLVYFLSNRERFLTIRGRHLVPRTKRPIGEPFVTYRFADSRHPPSSRFLFSVSRDKIVFSLDELASNLWMISLPKRD